MKHYEVIIIGAGAAGLMCAIEAGARRRQVLVLDHANKAGKKILMSGGGRCNFTNLEVEPAKYLSHNHQFVISALSRYTAWDFIGLINQHQIPYHEKTLGQLFCDRRSKDIVDMLLTECEQSQVNIQLNTSIMNVEVLSKESFKIHTSQGILTCESLVIATGGLSIPTMGATPFAYQLAQQMGIHVYPTRAGLVPLTLDTHDKDRYGALSGISLDAVVKNENEKIQFREQILLTHRGLSGPAILQLSSYWTPGEHIHIHLMPQHDLLNLLKKARVESPLKQLNTILAIYLPKRVIDVLIDSDWAEKKLAELSNQDLEFLCKKIQPWSIQPNGTEGYRTAEVTLGGVDCNAISSKTMEALNVPGLYFIGEALDVAGWLGGYNFQWAWSSGWAAGQVV
jgi:predicted Rossmann fold flavoprotein